LCGGAQRDSRLTDPAWAGDRDKTGMLKQGGESRELRLATDKTGRLNREPPLPGDLADEHVILT
jgi:hypothetical protein